MGAQRDECSAQGVDAETMNSPLITPEWVEKIERSEARSDARDPG